MKHVADRERYYSALNARVYWAFSAISPLMDPVAEALQAWQERLAADGMEAFGEAIEARQALRADLATVLGGEAGDYALTHGTSAGLGSVAQALKWRPKGAVVTFDEEFPANVLPWAEAARARSLPHVTLKVADLRGEAGPDLGPLEQALKGGAQFVAVSAVQFQSGYAAPLGEMAALCQRYDALLAVDAIQAAGIIPLDFKALGVDIAVGGGHKWLGATDGVGYIYVGDRAKARLGMGAAGWLSYREGDRFLFEPGWLHRHAGPFPSPRHLEAGSSDSGAVFGLRAALAVLQRYGIDEIWAHVQGLHDQLEQLAGRWGYRSERSAYRQGRSGTLSLLPPEGVGLREVQKRLSAQGIVVSIPDGRLRLAPHFVSHAGEIAIFAEAMDEIYRPS